MTICVRCGLPEKQLPLVWAPSEHLDPEACYAASVLNAHHQTAHWVIQCRDRQIANQAALLRSITGKLEEAGTLAMDAYEHVGGSDVGKPLTEAIELIDSVLEILA